MAGGGRFVGQVDGFAGTLARVRDFLAHTAIVGFGTVYHSWRLFLERPAESPKTGRRLVRLANTFKDRVPKLEALLTVVLAGATGAYGATLGNHWPTVQQAVLELPDSTANALGFGIRAVTLEGQRGLTDDEVMEALRVTDSHSLFFLSASAARDRLVQNPLVADATIRKVYPDRLAVTLVERNAFALWQQAGEVSIIAEDGTIIDQLRDRRFVDLPLVVGAGAAGRAREFEALVRPYPVVTERLYAGVLVAERRWNLRLRNGVDVLLPETGAEVALRTLTKLIERRDILDRDITLIDLRIPDQIVVRLSEEAAAELAKLEKPKKAKGGTT